MNTSRTMLCESCGEDRDFTPVQRKQTISVRGEPITAEVPLVECPVCKSTQFDPDSTRDPMVPIYAEYRRRHHLLFPDEIREIRTQYGMSPEAFASLLGMSPATLYRYEAGALQDEVHDALILLCRKPENVKMIAERHKEKLTPLQHKRYKAAISSPSRRRTRKRTKARP